MMLTVPLKGALNEQIMMMLTVPLKGALKGASLRVAPKADAPKDTAAPKADDLTEIIMTEMTEIKPKMI